MEVDDDLKEKILTEVAPVISGNLAASLIAVMGMTIVELVSTNHESDTPAGRVEVHPTDAGTTMAASEVSGTRTEGSLARDEVGAATGEVAAAETDARASAVEATAADNGATALRTRTGASDIETKALKMT